MNYRTYDNEIRYLITALAVALLPHILRLSPWVVMWCAGCWIYRILAEQRNLPLPGRAIRLLLTLTGLAAVFLTAGYRFGTHAYVGLMAVMAALKPFEVHSYRDKMVTLLLAYFIVITNLFESENFIYIVHMAASVFITTAILIHVHNPVGALRNKMRLSARIIAQAFPLMLILFFLFPRIHGQLWNLSTKNTGRTGFSDTLSIGDVARLVQDDAVAFTAYFQNKIPASANRYWRGIVFERFNGRRWTASPGPVAPLPEPDGNPLVTYTITLTPQTRRHLFALDLPVKQPPGTRIAPGFTLQANRSLRRKFKYTATSEMRMNSGPPGRVSPYATALPEYGNPRARSLAARWAGEEREETAILERALHYLKQKQFVYTLNPPSLSGDTIDQFIFETRKGYCEHFASAFVFLMRSAGIPARIVGGYLGGEVNPYSNFLTVRQSDAHAWAEVLIRDKGWIRVDPTAVVAPARVSGGIAAALPVEELPPGLASGRLHDRLPFLMKLQYGWDAFNMQWDIWFSGYSAEQQQNLLSKLGFHVGSRTGRILFLITAIVFSISALTLLFLFFQRRPKTVADQAHQIYHRFCAKLLSAGLRKAAAQGPRDFARAAAAQLPALSADIYNITDDYIRLRYGESNNLKALRRLKNRVANLKIPRGRPGNRMD